MITTRQCRRETRVFTSNLTWHCDKLRSLRSRVFERVFVEDVRDLRVLSGARGRVRLKRRQAQVLSRQAVIVHLQVEERSK